MKTLRTTALVGALTLTAGTAAAGGWSLNSDLSNISFGSIKNDYIGESHSFGEISGTVNHDGMVTLEIGLSSVQTNIDIRDERMVEFVFDKSPTATVTTEIDMDAMKAMGVGASTVTEAVGKLTLLGQEIELDANLFVMRLSEDRVLVTTDGMAMLSTEDAGIDAGIDKLQDLASLDSITRVSPVTMRLFFDVAK